MKLDDVGWLDAVGRGFGRGWKRLEEVERGWKRLEEVQRGWKRLDEVGKDWLRLVEVGWGWLDEVGWIRLIGLSLW